MFLLKKSATGVLRFHGCEAEAVISSDEDVAASLPSALRDFELVDDFAIGHDSLASEPIGEMPYNRTGDSGPTLAPTLWNKAIANGFSEFRATDPMMRLPWEQGVMNDIFGTSDELHQSL